MGETTRTILRAIDFETTGLPVDDAGDLLTEKHALVEIGWTDIILAPGEDPVVMEPYAELVDAKRAIPPEASAIHHIRDSDVAGKPSPDQVLLKLRDGVAYFVAHPIDYERKFYTGGDTPWLCTHKCSLRVWQDSPNHKLQTLRYYHHLDDDPLFDAALAFPPHRAGPDSYVNAHVMAKLLRTGTPIADMVRWSSGPALLVTCYLPKHRGKRWRQVAEDDRGYLHWVVEKSDLDRDHKATARYWLNKTERK